MALVTAELSQILPLAFASGIRFMAITKLTSQLGAYLSFCPKLSTSHCDNPVGWTTKSKFVMERGLSSPRFGCSNGTLPPSSFTMEWASAHKDTGKRCHYDILQITVTHKVMMLCDLSASVARARKYTASPIRSTGWVLAHQA